MKRLSIVFLIIVSALTFCQCSTVQKGAYGLVHGDEPVADANTLPGMTIIVTKTGERYPCAIDFTYNDDDTITYVRHVGEKFLHGTMKAADIKITNGHSELAYDKAAGEWMYIENGKRYYIYQHDYQDITINGEE